MSKISRQLFLDKVAGLFDGLFSDPEPIHLASMEEWRPASSARLRKANAVKMSGAPYSLLNADLNEAAVMMRLAKSTPIPDLTVGEMKAALQNFTSDPKAFRIGMRTDVYDHGGGDGCNISVKATPLVEVNEGYTPTHTLVTPRGKPLSTKQALALVGMMDTAMLLKKRQLDDAENFRKMLMSEYAKGKTVMNYMLGKY